jgi:hypothetical protein
MSEKLLGSLSPAYGMLSGKGAFGKLADSGLGGIIPSVLAHQRRKKKDGTEMTSEEEALAAKAGMKKGGKVKTKKYAKGGSIDGCAIKGKTKGKVC